MENFKAATVCGEAFKCVFATVKVTKQERQLVFEKYEGRCAYCGCLLAKGWHVDHLKPIRRKKYKKDECRYPQRACAENYMPACASCNINKHAMKLEDFRQLVEGFMKHLNERNTQYKIAKRFGLVVENVKPVVFYFEQYEKDKPGTIAKQEVALITGIE